MKRETKKRLVGILLFFVFLTSICYSLHSVLRFRPSQEMEELDAEFMEWSSQYLLEDARYGFLEVFGPIESQNAELWAVLLYEGTEDEKPRLDKVFILNEDFASIENEIIIEEVLIGYILCVETDFFDEQGNVTENIQPHLEFLQQSIERIRIEKKNMLEKEVEILLEDLNNTLERMIETYFDINGINVKNLYGSAAIEEKLYILVQNYEKSEKIVKKLIKNKNIFSNAFFESLSLQKETFEIQSNEFKKTVNFLQSEKERMGNIVEKEIKYYFGAPMHVFLTQDTVKYYLSNIILEAQELSLTHVQMDITVYNFGNESISEGYVFIPYSRTMIDSGAYIDEVRVKCESELDFSTITGAFLVKNTLLSFNQFIGTGIKWKWKEEVEPEEEKAVHIEFDIHRHLLDICDPVKEGYKSLKYYPFDAYEGFLFLFFPVGITEIGIVKIILPDEMKGREISYEGPLKYGGEEVGTICGTYKFLYCDICEIENIEGEYAKIIDLGKTFDKELKKRIDKSVSWQKIIPLVLNPSDDILYSYIPSIYIDEENQTIIAQEFRGCGNSAIIYQFERCSVLVTLSKVIFLLVSIGVLFFALMGQKYKNLEYFRREGLELLEKTLKYSLPILLSPWIYFFISERLLPISLVLYSTLSIIYLIIFTVLTRTRFYLAFLSFLYMFYSILNIWIAEEGLIEDPVVFQYGVLKIIHHDFYSFFGIIFSLFLAYIVYIILVEENINGRVLLPFLSYFVIFSSMFFYRGFLQECVFFIDKTLMLKNPLSFGFLDSFLFHNILALFVYGIGIFLFCQLMKFFFSSKFLIGSLSIVFSRAVIYVSHINLNKDIPINGEILSEVFFEDYNWFTVKYLSWWITIALSIIFLALFLKYGKNRNNFLEDSKSIFFRLLKFLKGMIIGRFPKDMHLDRLINNIRVKKFIKEKKKKKKKIHDVLSSYLRLSVEKFLK